MSWNVHKFSKLISVICSLCAVVPLSTSHRGQPNFNVFESGGSTEIKVTSLRYKWTIKNFSFCCQEYDQKLISPTFTDGTNNACEWKLQLRYPTEEGYYNDRNYVSLSISLSGCQAKVQYKFGILNANGEEIQVVNSTFQFDDRQETAFENFVERSFLLNEKNEVMVDNKLIIFCEISATMGSENLSKQYNSLLPKSNLKKDLRFLFDNEAFSDVTLSTTEADFKVLKAILAARSPIFKAMFEVDNSNSITTVELKDMDYQVVKEMLRYIYTDEPWHLEYFAPDLLVAAEKYKLDGLKTICENVISENLTIENAAKFYILGDTYSALDLKIQAKDFIANHVSSIVHTLAFKSLIKTHPHLVEEVFDAFSQKFS